MLEEQNFKLNDALKLDEKLVNNLVYAGTLATSADNCQPWRFSWNDNSLILKMDLKRSGFFYDINQESTYMTLGAVAENIRIAASHYGLHMELNPFPEGEEREKPVAEMFFMKVETSEDPMYPFLEKRCVNRRSFFKKPIDIDVLTKIAKEAEMFPGIALNWIVDDPSKKIMRKVVYAADRVLFEDERLHSGLFQWIRLKREDQGKLDGMGFDVLELNVFQKPLFKLFANWRIMSSLNKFGLSCLPGMNSMLLLRSSPVYCLLTVDKRTPEIYFKAGMTMERFWIAANASGLSVQPMAGFVFLLNHLRHDRAAQFSPQHADMIKNMDHGLAMLPMVPEHKIPTMFFRVGYAEKPSSRTKRLPLKEVADFTWLD